MEIISIGEDLFKDISDQIDSMASELDKIVRINERRVGAWLDSSDVCKILHVSKRTLHSYRSKGLLAHTRIEKKFYYDPDDIKRFIERNKDHNEK